MAWLRLAVWEFDLILKWFLKSASKNHQCNLVAKVDGWAYNWKLLIKKDRWEHMLSVVVPQHTTTTTISLYHNLTIDWDCLKFSNLRLWMDQTKPPFQTTTHAWNKKSKATHIPVHLFFKEQNNNNNNNLALNIGTYVATPELLTFSAVTKDAWSNWSAWRVAA